MSEDEDEVEPRIRLYPTSHAGPYTVYIRKKVNPLKPLSHTVYVNKYYNSVISAEHSRDKMKFVLGNVDQANKMISDKTFADYRVFINVTEVEIAGVIKFSDLCDLESFDDLIQNGRGTFDNSSNSVAIVEVHQFPVKAEGELSNAVKVTFEGRIVPTHITIFGLRVKVRPWFHRPMFCDRCQHFKHTDKFCTRPAKCAKCLGDHLTSECKTTEVDHTICPYCQTEHELGKKNCAYFKKVNKDFFKVQKRKYVQSVADITLFQEPPADIALEDARQWPDISSGNASPANCPQVAAASVPVSNSFSNLEIVTEEVVIPQIVKPMRPRNLPFANPWAANPASSSKKRKLDQGTANHKRTMSPQASYNQVPSSGCNRYSPSTSHNTSQNATSPPGFRPSENANTTGRRSGPPHKQQSTNPLSSLIMDMIINVASSLGLAEHWLALIRSVVPIIIDAVLSLTSPSSSCKPAVGPVSVRNE